MPDHFSKIFSIPTPALRRKSALKILALGALLAVSSFAIEYGSFAYQKNVSDNGHYAGIVHLPQDRISTDNFSLADQGYFVSQTENAALTVKNDSGFIRDLEVDLAKNPNLPVIVEFIDPKTGQKISIEDDSQTNLRKNGFVFLNYLVFPINNSPEEIRVVAKNSGTGISKISVDNSYHFNPYRFLFILAIEILLALFILFRQKIGQKPEIAFFAIAIVSGSLFSLCEPRFFVSWDEYTHYIRAENMSLGNLLRGGPSDIYLHTNLVPHSLSIKEQSSIDDYFDTRFRLDQASENAPSSFSIAKSYAYLAYIPSAIALTMGKALLLPNHIVFILGRWINIWLFAWLVYLAMKRLRSGKMILAVIALFPSMIFTASNYNYDSWVAGFTILGLAYLFGSLQEPEKKLELKEICIMIGAIIVGCGPKAIYFPLLIMLFLLRPGKFASSGQYKKFAIAGVLSIFLVLGSFLLPIIISGPGGGDTRGGKDVNPSGQIAFILSSPASYAGILFNSMKEYFDPRNIAKAIDYLAYLGNVAGYPLIILILLFTSLTDKDVRDKGISGWKTRWLAIGIFFCTAALIATTFYIGFTPLRNRLIVGVQPRYLLPLLFPLFFFIGDYRMKISWNKNISNSIVFGIMAAILLNGIWDLVIKFYH